MSDFIYSNKTHEKGILTKSIQSIYEESDKPEVKEFHGNWGSLAVSHNIYNGFDSYEDNQHIAVVIGGPILMYKNNTFLKKKISSEGTESIFKRWKNDKMNWVDDLSGPFAIVIIERKTGHITFITDLMSFIPVYKLQLIDEFTISTHVDVLAKISGEIKNIDIVSQVDFVMHGIVTYPYTMYEKIKQVSPATIHKYNEESHRYFEKNYWLPYEENINLSIKDTSIKLRNSINEYINKIVSETDNIAQFISGGEDSRTLSALLQPYERDAFIFIDEMNIEGKIAKKVAEIYGANLKVHTRHENHYSHILPSCSDLVGSGSQYHHAHTFGFHKTCNLQSYDAVFGGLFADALLKGSRIKKIHRTGTIPLIPEYKNNNYTNNKDLKKNLFKDECLSELTIRRKNHLKYVESFRSQSSEEWFEMWPSSMNMNIPNIHANRRLFRSYEPFMSNSVVKIAATVPQKWKLNRKLFHKMAKPLLKSSKWLRHGDGWFPYYPWQLKSITIRLFLLKRRIERKFNEENKVDGPWGDWNSITSSDDWHKMTKKYDNGVELLLPGIKKKEKNSIIYNDELTIKQHVNLVQILYMNSKEKIN